MKTSARIKTSAEAVASEHRPMLSAVFAPKSVALIGASERPDSVGRALNGFVRHLCAEGRTL